jgi:hypothetical protein
MTITDALQAVYRTSTPLVHISTPDPAATIAAAMATFTAAARAANEVPPLFLRWSVTRGIEPLTPEAQDFAREINRENPTEPVTVTGNPVDAMTLFARAISDRTSVSAVLFALQVDEVWTDAAGRQALWELRDVAKAAGSCFVGLSPGATPPPQIAGDILDLDEPLPDAEALAEIVTETAANVDGLDIDDATRARAVEALTGLAAYPADQALSLSLSKDGIDLPALWERKRRMIDQTPGLTVYRGKETFADIGGNENIKAFLSRILAGRRKPGAVVIIDEIEKALAGAAGDTSGTSQDQLGALLTEMQETDATGILALGPPGTGKTAAAKAAGNEGSIPTMMLDLGATKSSLVGSSEARLRAALKTVRAVSNGQPLYIATCNSIASLPPELRRRFHLGTFFFDLPTPAERQAIWEIYKRRFCCIGEHPPDDGWTGAEIKNCCDLADRLAISLTEAAAYIVPVSISARDVIERLRQDASGRYTSANTPGVYQFDATTQPNTRQRRIRSA